MGYLQKVIMNNGTLGIREIENNLLYQHLFIHPYLFVSERQAVMG